MRRTAPHMMRRKHTAVAAVFLWGACAWLFSSGGSSLALGPALRGASESASAPSPSSTFVYAGADLDVHMLKYLAEDETRAVFLDPMGIQSKFSNELGDPLGFSRHHAHDPRPSFRRDSRPFRTFRIHAFRIHAFRDMLRDRFRDEEFKDVHLHVDGPKTVKGSFRIQGDKIRREFTYIIQGMNAAVLRGHHVTTFVTLGYVGADSDVPGAWKHTIRRRIMGRKQAPNGAVIYPLPDYPARDTQAGPGSQPVMVFSHLGPMDEDGHHQETV